MTLFYAIGDIHGYADQLERALSLIDADGGSDAPLVFLGDLVDRGPDSRGVIERVKRGQDEGRDWTCVLGNHDRMFLRFVTEGIMHDDHIASGKSWLHPALGGPMTLASYGITADAPPVLTQEARGVPETLESFVHKGERLDQAGLAALAREMVPTEHLDWIAALPRTHEAHGFTFVHAGLRPGVPLADQVEDDLVWIREGWLDSDGHAAHMVVHGHTVIETPTRYPARINTDAGAGYGNPLVPCCFDGAWWTLDEGGRRPMATG